MIFNNSTCSQYLNKLKNYLLHYYVHIRLVQTQFFNILQIRIIQSICYVFFSCCYHSHFIHRADVIATPPIATIQFPFIKSLREWQIQCQTLPHNIPSALGKIPEKKTKCTINDSLPTNSRNIFLGKTTKDHFAKSKCSKCTTIATTEQAKTSAAEGRISGLPNPGKQMLLETYLACLGGGESTSRWRVNSNPYVLRRRSVALPRWQEHFKGLH